MKNTKLQEILSGWANEIKDNFNKLPEEIKKLSEERLLICNTCDVRKNEVCSSSNKGVAVKSFMYGKKLREKGTIYKGCGCPLKAKTKSVTSVCPLGKW